MLGHDLQTSFESDFTALDLPRASSDELVIRVDLRSSETSKATFGDWISLISPLSLKAEHLERFKLRRDVMKGDVDKA